MKTSTVIAATFAAGLVLSPVLMPTAVRAQGGTADPANSCSPTVSAALGTWDLGMKAAETFGEKAVALAREKGREYLLPLLGIDPKTAPATPAPNTGPSAGPSADEIAREVEASRDNPKRRAELCAAITGAVNEARNTAGAGLDALKRAIDGLRSPAAAPPAPGTPPTTPDGLIKT